MENLRDMWLRSGIEKDDTVLIHSNIGRTIIEYNRVHQKRIGPIEVLESFLEAVGPQGTLLFPLFNFDFTKGHLFDVRSTPSHMGALTESARTHPDAVRTGHPIYSFCALGKNSKLFEGVDNRSAFSNESPFGILRKLNGKIAVLDLEETNSMTFYHYIEEVNQVDYRYFKDFSGQYTDANGNTSERLYSIFVRDLEQRVVSNSNQAGELLWLEGLYEGCRPNKGTGLRVIQSQKVFDFVSSLITDGKAEGTLFKYGDIQ